MIETFRSMMHLRKNWHSFAFSEMRELYLSMSLKQLALSLIGIFMPVLLYRLGNSVQDIALFFALSFGLRVVGQFFFAYVVSLKGPKHVLRYSYGLLLVLLILLLTLEDRGWPLWLVAMAYGWHMAAFFIGYHVDFSKIRSHSHSGSQVASMMIALKVASALGPLIGGLVAAWFGIEWTLTLAIVLIIAAVLPLLASGEPVRTHQTLRWKGIVTRKNWRAIALHSGVAIDQTVGVFIWPLVLGAFIFSDNAYAGVGFVFSATLLVSVMLSRFLGRYIDAAKKTNRVMDVSALFLATSHLGRAFVQSVGGVLFVGGLSEVGVMGSRIQFMKTYYELVDDLKGQRIAAVTLFESINASTRALFWVLVAVLADFLGEYEALRVAIIIGILGPVLLAVQNTKS